MTHEMLHKHTERRRARGREAAGECVRDGESEIDSYWEDFQQASSWEYCGAAAEMLGMLMLLLIMQPWNQPATQKHTRQHLRDNTLAKANTTDNFYIISISNSRLYIVGYFLIQDRERCSPAWRRRFLMLKLWCGAIASLPFLLVPLIAWLR